jgi:hypothetical protein
MANTDIDLRGPQAVTTTRPGTDRSLGELIADATGELSTLMRKEVELAKAELKQDAAALGKGLGAFGGAGFTAHLAVIFLSLAAMFGLDAVLPLWAAALIVGVVYLGIAATLGLIGKKAVGQMPGVPRTVKTIKEDVEWARHPTS